MVTDCNYPVIVIVKVNSLQAECVGHMKRSRIYTRQSGFDCLIDPIKKKKRKKQKSTKHITSDDELLPNKNCSLKTIALI